MAGPIRKTRTTRRTTRRKTSGTRNTLNAIVKKAEKAISGDKNILRTIGGNIITSNPALSSAFAAGLRTGGRATKKTKARKARKAPTYRG